MALLEIKDLRKQFHTPDGEPHTVVNIKAFALGHAQQMALEGGSGSGKTTFLNLIAGILSADAGSILIDRQDICAGNESKRDKLRAQNIGYIFQTFNLLQGFTAIENVALGMAFGGGVDLAYARQLLSQVGLSDRADYLPRQMSVGQQQRVAVARALANKPKLVLADEPTGNLDRRNASEALDLIRNICETNGASLLLVSHDRDVLSKFDHLKKFEEVNDQLSA